MIESKFEEWYWELEDGFRFRAERFFQSLDSFSSKEARNQNLSLWMQSAYEAAYKEGYRDALASLHYKPDNGSGNAAVMHLQ